MDTIAKPCNHRNVIYYFDIIIITKLNSSDILITHKVYYLHRFCLLSMDFHFVNTYIMQKALVLFDELKPEHG